MGGLIDHTILVCRLLSSALRKETLTSPEFKHVTSNCREIIQAARMASLQIAHVYNHWPDDARLLHGCEPRAIEPVFSGYYSSPFAHEPIEAFCRQSRRASIMLIGVYDQTILELARNHAARMNFRIIEPERALLTSHASRESFGRKRQNDG